jgi:hypothetical protein
MVVWFVVGLVFLLVLILRHKSPSLDREIKRAVSLQDTAALLLLIKKRKLAVQPISFHHAIKSLWDRYERSLSMDLIRELAEAHSDTSIAQYWLSQALSVEPGEAQKKLGQDFIQRTFQPEVAAKCGSVG